MFTELADLAKTTTLHLTISTIGDEMKVIVMPQSKDGLTSACQPLALTATPAELDEKFAEIITSYKTAKKSMEEALEESKSYMEAVATAAKETAAKATVKPVVAKPTATVVTVDVAPEDDDADDLFA